MEFASIRGPTERLHQTVRTLVSCLAVPSRTMAIQYFLHGLPILCLVMFENISYIRCDDSKLSLTTQEHLKGSGLGMMDLCVNQTLLGHVNLSWKTTVIFEEILSYIVLLFLTSSQQRSERVVAMTLLVPLSITKLSSTVIVPLKLQLEETLTQSSFSVVELFIYPIKLITWTALNLVSLPFTSMTFKDIIITEDIDVPKAAKSATGNGWSAEVLDHIVNTDKDHNYWWNIFVPWGNAGLSRGDSLMQCTKHCTTSVNWPVVLFSMSTAVHLMIVLWTLLLPLLEEASTYRNSRPSVSEKKQNRTGKQLNFSRLSYDEQLHRQSFADEGFGESLSMETVLADITGREASPKFGLSYSGVTPSFRLTERSEFHQIEEKESLEAIEELKGKETRKSKEGLSDISVKIKSLIETNINDRPFVCLPTGVMMDVCDKLFTRNSAHLGYSGSDELLKAPCKEKLCDDNLPLTEKRLAKDALETLLGWYKENLGQNSLPAVNGSEDDGYSDDESFINGFRL